MTTQQWIGTGIGALGFMMWWEGKPITGGNSGKAVFGGGLLLILAGAIVLATSKPAPKVAATVTPAAGQN